LVAAVAQVGEPLRHDYSFHGLVRYAFLFGLIWWAWNGHTYFHSRFNCDDGLNSVLAVLQTFIAAGVPGAERMATRSAAGYSVAALIWIGSAFLAPPLRYAGWGAGALLEALTYGAAHRGDAAVPPDSHHFPERHGLFTIILFGELIAAIMHGIQGQESWSAGAASAAIAGLGFGFLLRSWYFDGAGGACERLVEDAKQRRLFQVWNCAHLPLFLGIGIAGIGLQKLINTDPAAWGRDGTAHLLGLSGDDDAGVDSGCGGTRLARRWMADYRSNCVRAGAAVRE